MGIYIQLSAPQSPLWVYIYIYICTSKSSVGIYIQISAPQSPLWVHTYSCLHLKILCGYIQLPVLPVCRLNNNNVRYHAPVDPLSAHVIHNNIDLNTILYTHVEHSLPKQST